MACLGFLHTADAHIATFDELVDNRVPPVRTTHVVDRSLLELAVRHGAAPQIQDGIKQRLIELGQAGADAIVCTCSTLGPAVDAVAPASAVPVVRIDRPMAEHAARIGRQIAVVAALQATVAPTVALLEACAAEPPTIVPELCIDAWAAFLGGDLETYLEQVTQAARRAAPNADVVVLAQASMAPALRSLEDIDVPVLASPELAVQAALRCCPADDAPSSPTVG